jgi:hypothetical protein
MSYTDTQHKGSQQNDIKHNDDFVKTNPSSGCHYVDCHHVDCH